MLLWLFPADWCDFGRGSGAVRRLVRLEDAAASEPGKTGSHRRTHFSLRLPTLECDHFDPAADRGKGVAEQFGRFHFSFGSW